MVCNETAPAHHVPLSTTTLQPGVLLLLLYSEGAFTYRCMGPDMLGAAHKQPIVCCEHARCLNPCEPTFLPMADVTYFRANASPSPLL